MLLHLEVATFYISCLPTIKSCSVRHPGLKTFTVIRQCDTLIGSKLTFTWYIVQDTCLLRS